jgi:hypothetical protein
MLITMACHIATDAKIKKPKKSKAPLHESPTVKKILVSVVD